MEPRRSVHESAPARWGGLFPHRERWHASVFRRLMSQVIDRRKAWHLSEEIIPATLPETGEPLPRSRHQDARLLSVELQEGGAGSVTAPFRSSGPGSGRAYLSQDHRGFPSRY